ncbi:hypothetical protein BO94DRAFT_622735 [Aspergillus sclerotioniger CBS 115572]|uniref:F-box domain-containing protein n=1 Tax=Aspergillus sclerotioniger CBS 115572 TaxID=1450535 RepID=A0A317X101_9EURO|nr:hypothetical protein BO94DRAFT_622735 [Aspergillus sclerotioniger CBS 115572]PWY91975.1 hypothetical protein BO94DRAFT_622735 [Aspergillus sclerotioniger CBS 115572]
MMAYISTGPREFVQYLLCGAHIGKMANELPWRDFYRALYQNRGVVALSGVGERKDFCYFQVPADRNTLSDAMTTDEYTTLLKLRCQPWNILILHDICWQHLVQHWDPDDIDLECLFNVLCKLPKFPDNESRFGEYAYPFETPTLEQLQQSQRELPSRRHIEEEEKLAPRRNSTDCFRRLPREIREMVGALLLTSDALSARLASRSMSEIFDSQMFWRSRFEVNAERGFLSHFLRQLQRNRTPFDWRLLYHNTCQIRCGTSFDLTIKVWENRRWVADALNCQAHGVVAATPPLMEFGGRALHNYHGTIWPGTHIETVMLPPDLVRVGIAVVMEHGSKATRVTGLEFICDHSPSASLGYKTPGARVMKEEEPGAREILHPISVDFLEVFLYPGVQILMEAASLQGYGIYRDSEGTRLLQLLRDGGDTEIVGLPNIEASNQEQYQFRMDKVVAVTAALDVHGINDLGIRGFGNHQARSQNLYFGRDIFDTIPI